MDKELDAGQKDFTIVDQWDFDNTQKKTSELKSLVVDTEWFEEHEKEELLKHIDDLAKQNLGL